MLHVMNIVNRTPPEELFHYSDFNALVGIIKNKQIWMGDLFFLNDEKEYQLGLDLFKKQLEIQKGICQTSPFLIFLNSLDSIDSLLLKKPPFSFSLTEEGDLLSQWRGYTKNGIGVSIGFRSSNLKSGGFQLFPCIYALEEQEAYIKHLFELAFKTFNETSETGKHEKSKCTNPLELPHWDAINEAGSALISWLNVACALIKDSSFKEEKEWRLVNFERYNIDFLAKDSYLKPIKKIPIEPQHIVTSIKVGPNPNKVFCKNSICALLDTCSLDSVLVSFSDIPYRN
ncbi:DUF2971 domain-containing protein [Aeromonas media]|uniref:DUF2971 domain-containing protein n=1 Tax=Aeromonas media TaxID=651 RepID=UPI002282E21D|nr:DUF2971 domain-containing protein [Aeromonas media]MCY9835870.1 DUF2971 domain-containing protein [Aeromonas media]